MATDRALRNLREDISRAHQRLNWARRDGKRRPYHQVRARTRREA